MTNKNEKASNLLPTLEYQGNKIAMEVLGNDVKVNVTEFAKCFPEKNLSQIIQSDEIQEYIRTLSDIYNYISADLLQVRKGGDPTKQGTWANRKVALRIAQKLSSEFAIMVDTKIEELLYGKNTSQKLTQTGTYNEGQVFYTTLGKRNIRGVYLNGQVWYQLSTLMKHLGYMQAGGKVYAQKFGEQHCIYHELGSQHSWFVNREWIDKMVNYVRLDLTPANAVTDIYHDLFNVNIVSKGDTPYAYRFTEKDMLEVIAIINRMGKPALQSQLIEKLLKGGAA